MRILVIGGTGFIGQHVIRALTGAGHALTVFHRGKTETELPGVVNYLYGDGTGSIPTRDAWQTSCRPTWSTKRRTSVRC